MTCARSAVLSGYSGSSTNKTDCHDSAESGLKHHNHTPITTSPTVLYALTSVMLFSFVFPIYVLIVIVLVHGKCLCTSYIVFGVQHDFSVGKCSFVFLY